MVRTEEDTSIPLKKRTRERLGTFGNKNESWDKLLNRLMDDIESHRGYEKLKSDLEVREDYYKEEIALLKDEIKNMVDRAEELD